MVDLIKQFIIFTIHIGIFNGQTKNCTCNRRREMKSNLRPRLWSEGTVHRVVFVLQLLFVPYRVAL